MFCLIVCVASYNSHVSGVSLALRIWQVMTEGFLGGDVNFCEEREKSCQKWETVFKLSELPRWCKPLLYTLSTSLFSVKKGYTKCLLIIPFFLLNGLKKNFFFKNYFFAKYIYTFLHVDIWWLTRNKCHVHTLIQCPLDQICT